MSITELKKHQHVVPRFYLKQFSEEVEKDNFQIYCLYKRINSKPFRTKDIFQEELSLNLI